MRGIDTSLPCPLCKEIFTIPGNDVANLKNNFFIVSLLHFVADSKKIPSSSELGQVEKVSTCEQNQTDQVATATCGACNDLSPLNSFCEHCSIWLCVTCSKSHSRLPLTSTHPLLSMDDVNIKCKTLVEIGEKALHELEMTNTEKQDILFAQIQQVPENIISLRQKISSAAEEAQKIISEKVTNFLQQVEEFQREEERNLSEKLDAVEETRKELERLQTILGKVKISNDGFQNQVAIKTVENFLNGLTSFNLKWSQARSSLAFNSNTNFFHELNNLELGQLRSITGKSMPLLFLNERALTLHKIERLTEREYISALAINKFAEKFVVTSNQTVVVFKPDSRIPRSFVSPLCERVVNKPWGVAYSEADGHVFISEAGRHEGDGAVISYSRDGKYHSVIASGLTLPRGIAVYKSFIFVCDQLDKCVYILNFFGKIIRVLKKTADGKNLFTGPMFVSVGKSGRLAVSDDCRCVKVFDQDCNLLFTYISQLSDSEFWDVHVTKNNDVIVCDWRHGLHKISSHFKSNGLIRTESSTLIEPSALATLENGNSIYIGTCNGDIFSAI